MEMAAGLFGAAGQAGRCGTEALAVGYLVCRRDYNGSQHLGIFRPKRSESTIWVDTGAGLALRRNHTPDFLLSAWRSVAPGQQSLLLSAVRRQCGGFSWALAVCVAAFAGNHSWSCAACAGRSAFLGSVHRRERRDFRCHRLFCAGISTSASWGPVALVFLALRARLGLV